ncbi:MAG: L-iditol 2-dehydrogenase [Candidatus Ordinivivax streblomastigis]|uniref:L-iditol 2-dehydrogenase n=1 Tax=Candidatus Ordinivivax streblomastigis TaxID=2540710 RepID=A0A5M8NZB3_9BACT|nr:MAG: L-iditol 2-dehydrogenase [Candidatus Ordinivivax streblomastigis]
MKQARVIKPGIIEFVNVEDPASKKLADNEILLKIHRIGVCGSDIHVMHGQHPFVTYPVIQGHEYGASVVAVGAGVTKVKPGDKATARPQLVCGECPPCKKGRYNVCQNLRVQGFQAPGAAQSHFIVPEDRLIYVDNGLPFDEIAMIEPCAVGVHATSRTDLIGKNVVITGAGTIGNLVAQFALARGAKKVLITDVSDLRLEKAKTCGIEYTANTLKEKFEDAIQRVFGDELFQVAFEVSAAQQCITDLVATIEKGSVIVIVGVFTKPALVDLAVVDEHEITLIGSMMYKHEDFELAAELLRDEKINVKPLVTQHFDFEDYAEAYKFIDNHREECMKVIVNMPE